MDFQQLANLGEIIGGVAVVVSLIYLAIQVRQNTLEQQTENYTRALDRVSALQSQFGTNGELAAMFSRGARNTSVLSPQERIQFTWILYEMFGAFEFMFHASQSGAMPDAVWKRWAITIRFWMGQPGVRTWWQVRPIGFTEEFSAYVESLPKTDPVDQEASRGWEAFVTARQTGNGETFV
jgi:hypothetical protein